MRRACHDLCEYLSERLFMCSAQGGKVTHSEAIVQPARLLMHKKCASTHISALRQLLAHPFSQGRRSSPCISHFVWDRAMFEPCWRLIQQKHAAFWSSAEAQTHFDGWLHQAADLDLMVANGCSLHDLATAFKWATKPISTAEDIKALHLTIEGLRYGGRFMHSAIPEFLASCLHFDEGGEQTDAEVPS